jgi:two-component system response regulator AtoC
VACLTDPTNPKIIKDCGHAYLHSGDLANAIECYDKAEMLGGNFIDVKYNRALLSLNERRMDEARILLASIAENPPNFKPGQFYFGLLFPDVDHFLAEVHLYLGLIMKEEKDFENALHHFKTSYELNDEKISALHNLADIYLHLKQYGTAIEKYHELMNRMPAGDELIDIHINLALACYRNGQTDEAIAELHWILRRDPGNPTAIHNLNQIYEKEGIIKGSQDQKSRIQIVNLTEGASPIFGLTRGDGTESNLEVETSVRIIGKSQGMLRVMRHARLAASSDSTVLIIGENGTGKELLAKAIYYNSSRRDKPFVIVNCAAIPEALLESDLFGHEKGSFTGAYAQKIGRFEMAGEGSIFLDEIAELSPKLQVKLLRVLQEKEFNRVGGTETIKVDVRIIAATNSNLKNLISEGLFREDLYYRLNVLPIYIPSLRERPEDIQLLVNFFLKKFHRRSPQSSLRVYQNQKVQGLSEEDMAVLMEYYWPGNVRELENVIERAVVMGTNSSLYIEELAKLKKLSLKARKEGEIGFALNPKTSNIQEEDNMTLAEMEKEYIKHILTKTEGNQRKAAGILGINPTTLWRKLKIYNVEIDTISTKENKTP